MAFFEVGSKPMLMAGAELKARLRVALVSLLCGWTMVPSPAAAQTPSSAAVSPALQMVLDRVQQEYLAKKGWTLRQVETQSPLTMATLVGLVLRGQRYYTLREAGLLDALQELSSESLTYLNRIAVAVGYRDSWQQKPAGSAELQSHFYAAVAGQADQWALNEFGLFPAPGEPILPHVRIVSRPPPPVTGAPLSPPAVAGRVPSTPPWVQPPSPQDPGSGVPPVAQPSGPPPGVQPPADPSARPLVPMQDPRSITLLGQSADPREQAPPAAPDPGRPGGMTDAQRLADAADWTYRGTIAMQQKRYQEALQNYNNALKLSPENANYWANRADLYRKLNRNDLALADISKAIQTRPSYHWYWGQRASIYLTLGQKQQALPDLDQQCRLSRAESLRLQSPGMVAGCRQAEDIRAGRM